MEYEGAQLNKPADSLICCSCPKHLRPAQKNSRVRGDYHVHDFVYIYTNRPARSTETLRPVNIGQIEQFQDRSSGKTTVIIHVVWRHDEFLHNDATRDCRRLVLTNEREAALLARLEAVCQVRLFGSNKFKRMRMPQMFKDKPDYFWYEDMLVPSKEASLAVLRHRKKGGSLRRFRRWMCQMYDLVYFNK